MIKLEWNPLKENSIITGASQKGKTHLGRSLAKLLWLKGYNVIVVDVHRKFTKIDPFSIKRNTYDITGKGLEILQPFEFTKEWFENLCLQIYSMRNVVFMIDELQNFTDTYVIRGPLKILTENCNNRNIGYMAIFQRPAEIPKFVLNNSTHRFCFYFDLPTDIAYMKKWIGPEVEKFLAEDWPEYYGLYKRQGKKGAEMFKV